MTANPTRPVFRYHGGKWKMADWIISNFPRHKRYVEPFGGAGSVLLKKERAGQEIYNDLDGDIVNVFRVLRDPKASAELARLLDLTPYAREEYEAAFEPCDEPIERARRYVIKAAFSIGGCGMMKHRHIRSFNTRNSQNWEGYVKNLAAITKRLVDVVIENKHFLEVIADHDSEDTLYYLDPPYVAGSRASYDKYACDMSDKDHVLLAEAVHGLKGMAIISGYQSELYEQLYTGWERRWTHALDMTLKRTNEFIWISPNAAKREGKLF
jgi:DNA adenine methylase